MSLLDVLRSGIKVADGVTQPLQALVQYARKTGLDQYGPTYAAPVFLRAIVDYKALMVRTTSGELTATRATITLLDVAAIATATSGAGIGNEDIFTLPDGDTGKILDLSGFVDAVTGNPVATMVMLG